MRSRDRITMVTGLAALAVAVLAVGGASRWIVIAVTVLAVLAAGAQIKSRRRLGRLSPLIAIIGFAVALTAIQLVPLPDAVVGALQPATHDLIVDGEQLAGATSAWRPLTVDPGTTRVELVKLCGYLLLAWMALRAAASERGRQRLLAGVAGVAGVVALIGIVHELLGAETLFGVYAPAHVKPIVMAPLLNANHLACLMMLGALTAGGLAFHERRAPAVRAMWIAVAVLCVGVGLWTRSRGGVMGLAAGVTVGAVVMVLQRLREAAETKRRDVLRVAIPAAVIVLCTLVLVVVLGGGGVSDDLQSTQLAELSDPRSKYAAWGSALTLIEEAPVLGVGRGGFESAFTRVHPASSHVTFSHVENEYLQALVDWGVVGAVGLAAAFGFAALVILRRWRNGALAAGAIGGLAAVGVHSLVDFGLELPGVAIPTIIVAATLLYVPIVEASPSRRRFLLRVGVIAGALVAAVIAATPLARTLDEDHAALQADDATIVDARASLERHPLDYISVASAARHSTSLRARIAYLNHALRLHPNHPGLHRTVARWLAQGGRTDQAAIEYRLALLGSEDPALLVTEILSVFPTATTAVDALPAEHPGWSAITVALTTAKRIDLALAYLVKVVDSKAVKPTPEMWRRMATLANQAGDLALAERSAKELARIEPSVASTIGLAKVELQRKAYDEAIATLTPVVRELVTSREHVEARFLLCEVHIARPDWPAARTCLTETLLAPAVTLEMRRRIHGRLATVEEALGNKERAAFEQRLASPGRTGEPRSGIDGSGGTR